MKVEKFGKFFYISTDVRNEKNFGMLHEINSNLDYLTSFHLGSDRAFGITCDEEVVEWKRDKNLKKEEISSFFFLSRKPAYQLFKMKFTKILVNSIVCLGLENEGNVFIWGSHKDGLLGLGYDITSVENPTKLDMLKNIKEISMSENHAVVIDNQGEAYSWGSGKYGELGLERTIYCPFPRKIKMNHLFSKVFCSNLLTCFLDQDAKFSYFGVIIQNLKGSHSLKNLLNDESNSDPLLLFQERFIDELENEAFITISIGNGFIGLLSNKGMVFTLDFADNITLLFSQYFVYSLNVSSNQLFGLCKDNNKPTPPATTASHSLLQGDDITQSDDLSGLILHQEPDYYLNRWVAKFMEGDVTSDAWSSHIYKISNEINIDSMHLEDSQNKNILLFFDSTNPSEPLMKFRRAKSGFVSPVASQLKCMTNNQMNHNEKEDNVNINASFLYDECLMNKTYNDLTLGCLNLLKKNNSEPGIQILSLVTVFDDSYNMKYKRIKNFHGALALANPKKIIGKSSSGVTHEMIKKDITEIIKKATCSNISHLNDQEVSETTTVTDKIRDINENAKNNIITEDNGSTNSKSPNHQCDKAEDGNSNSNSKSNKQDAFALSHSPLEFCEDTSNTQHLTDSLSFRSNYRRPSSKPKEMKSLSEKNIKEERDQSTGQSNHNNSYSHRNKEKEPLSSINDLAVTLTNKKGENTSSLSESIMIKLPKKDEKSYSFSANNIISKKDGMRDNIEKKSTSTNTPLSERNYINPDVIIRNLKIDTNNLRKDNSINNDDENFDNITQDNLSHRNSIFRYNDDIEPTPQLGEPILRNKNFMCTLSEDDNSPGRKFSQDQKQRMIVNNLRKNYIYFSKIIYRMMTVINKRNKKEFYSYMILGKIISFGKQRKMCEVMTKLLLAKLWKEMGYFFTRWKSYFIIYSAGERINAVTLNHIRSAFSHFKHKVKIFSVKKKYFSELIQLLERSYVNIMKSRFVVYFNKLVYYKTNLEGIENCLHHMRIIVSRHAKRFAMKILKQEYLILKVRNNNTAFLFKILDQKDKEIKSAFIDRLKYLYTVNVLLCNFISKKHFARIFFFQKAFQTLKNFALENDEGVFMRIRMKKILIDLMYRGKLNLMKYFNKWNNNATKKSKMHKEKKPVSKCNMSNFRNKFRLNKALGFGSSFTDKNEKFANLLMAFIQKRILDSKFKEFFHFLAHSKHEGNSLSVKNINLPLATNFSNLLSTPKFKSRTGSGTIHSTEERALNEKSVHNSSPNINTDLHGTGKTQSDNYTVGDQSQSYVNSAQSSLNSIRNKFKNGTEYSFTKDKMKGTETNEDLKRGETFMEERTQIESKSSGSSSGRKNNTNTNNNNNNNSTFDDKQSHQFEEVGLQSRSYSRRKLQFNKISDQVSQSQRSSKVDLLKDNSKIHNSKRKLLIPPLNSHYNWKSSSLGNLLLNFSEAAQKKSSSVVSYPTIPQYSNLSRVSSNSTISIGEDSSNLHAKSDRLSSRTKSSRSQKRLIFSKVLMDILNNIFSSHQKRNVLKKLKNFRNRQNINRKKYSIKIIYRMLKKRVIFYKLKFFHRIKNIYKFFLGETLEEEGYSITLEDQNNN